MTSKGFPEIDRKVEVEWPDIGWVAGKCVGHLSSQWEYTTLDERLPPWEIVINRSVPWRYVK